MLQRSLISMGNNYRIKKALQKSRGGEEVALVYLGASITMKRSEENDKGFATLSYQFFRDTFGKQDNIRYINAGMNGTTSTMGLIRADRDVLSYNPEIVFVEFAVNDSKDNIQREIFESLILRLLKAESKPAVILLFMSSEAGYSCQGHMQVIGEHYKLPMISICDAVLTEIGEKRMSWKEYSDDNIHPNESGNRIVAECIAHFYRVTDAAPEQEEALIPEQPFFGNAYTSMKLLEAGDMKPVSLGSFVKEEAIKEFRYGLVYQRNTGNKSLKIKLRCRSLFVIYKETNNSMEGDAQIFVDGRIKGIMSGYRIFGWGNPVSVFVFREDQVREHIIEVKMAPGDEGKEFTLLAFGYCD